MRSLQQKHQLFACEVARKAKAAPKSLPRFRTRAVIPILDIVIVSYNTKQLTLNCIASINHYTTVPYRIILVDNASADGTVEAVKVSYPDVVLVINHKNLGYGKACNAGAYVSSNPYILFLNTDTAFFDPNWAQTMIKVFEDPKVAVVGPRLINQNNLLTGCGVVGTNANPYIRGWMEPANSRDYNEQIECVSICGACFMIKRDNIKTLGLFSPEYPFYFEETDYCYNARDKGYKCIYTPDTTVYHFHGGSSKDRPQLLQWFEEGRQLFDKKWEHMMGDVKQYG